MSEDGGLRSAISDAAREWCWEQNHEELPDTPGEFADRILALPEITTLRAAADRVRELADECEAIGDDRKAGIFKRSLNRAVGRRVRAALDGPA